MLLAYYEYNWHQIINNYFLITTYRLGQPLPPHAYHFKISLRVELLFADNYSLTRFIYLPKA